MHQIGSCGRVERFISDRTSKTARGNIKLVCYTCLLYRLLMLAIDSFGVLRILLVAKTPIWLMPGAGGPASSTIVHSATFLFVCFRIVRVKLELTIALMLVLASVDLAMELLKLLLFLGQVMWLIDCRLLRDQSHFVEFFLSRHLLLF